MPQAQNQLNMNGQRIVTMADPLANQDATTKQYVDAIVPTLDAKASVRLATTGNINLSNIGATIDGVTINDQDRILVKDQTTPSQNGIYYVQAQPPNVGVRASDMNAWANVPGASVFVEEGTLNADTGWVCTADRGGTLGTTAINWKAINSQTYKGDYAAGTYQHGDIVVYNGVAYMAVRPTIQTPAPWPGLPGITSYGTGLPTTPYDGQEAILVDSVSAPTWQWRFRYNAQSSSSYKWECIGSTPAVHEILADEGTSSTTYVDLTTVGPQITLPRAGDYMVSFGLGTYVQGGSGTSVLIAPKRGAAATSDNDCVQYDTTTGFKLISMERTVRMLGMSASDVVKLQYKISGTATTGQYRNRWINVIPIRVS